MKQKRLKNKKIYPHQLKQHVDYFCNLPQIKIKKSRKKVRGGKTIVAPMIRSLTIDGGVKMACYCSIGVGDLDVLGSLSTNFIVDEGGQYDTT